PLPAQFFPGPRPGTAGQRGAGLHPPIAGRVLRGAGRRTGRPAPRRLPHPPTGEVRQWLWRRGAAAELDDSLALGPEAIAQRGALLADLPTVRLAARGRAPRLPGRRVAPAALPWQPVVLPDPGFPQVARRVAPGGAGPAAQPGGPARGPSRPARAAVGLAARGPWRRRGRRTARPGAQPLQAHPSLGPRAARPGRAGPDG